MTKRTREGDLPFRVENSGLIDLDELMRQAESAPKPTPKAPPIVETAPPSPASQHRPSKRGHMFLIGIGVGVLGFLIAIGAWQRHAVVLATPKPAPVVAVVPHTPVEDKTSIVPADPPVAPAIIMTSAPAASPAKRGTRSIASTAPPEPAMTSVVSSVLLPDTPATDSDLGGAMRSAVGARDDVPRTTTNEESNARQLRPAPGAVVGAIQAALPEARACLGPDDPIRRGEIVFRSDGSVEKVELEGARATDACIRQALSKAKVAPFVDERFATRVTVRP